MKRLKGNETNDRVQLSENEVTGREWEMAGTWIENERTKIMDNGWNNHGKWMDDGWKMMAACGSGWNIAGAWMHNVWKGWNGGKWMEDGWTIVDNCWKLMESGR